MALIKKFATDNTPVWFISLEGLNEPFFGPRPAPAPGSAPFKVPNDIEQVDFTIDSNTGACLSAVYDRSSAK